MRLLSHALHCSSGAFSAVMMPVTEARMSTSHGSRSSSSEVDGVPADNSQNWQCSS